MELQPANPLQQAQLAFGRLQQGAANALSSLQSAAQQKLRISLPGQPGTSSQQHPKRVTFAHSAPFAAIIPGDSVAEVVFTTGINNFLNLYNTALIVRLVLTWFPNPPAFIVGPLATLCDPYLNLFRGIIPPLGGTLDFSPILAFVTLSVFTNTAAALPCEVGPDGRTPVTPGSSPVASRTGLDWAGPVSKFQQAWAQRVMAAKQQGPSSGQQ